METAVNKHSRSISCAVRTHTCDVSIAICACRTAHIAAPCASVCRVRAPLACEYDLGEQCVLWEEHAAIKSCIRISKEALTVRTENVLRIPLLSYRGAITACTQATTQACRAPSSVERLADSGPLQRMKVTRKAGYDGMIMSVHVW